MELPASHSPGCMQEGDMNGMLWLRVVVPVLGWLVLAAFVAPACDDAPTAVAKDALARANFARAPVHRVAAVVEFFAAPLVRDDCI